MGDEVRVGTKQRVKNACSTQLEKKIKNESVREKKFFFVSSKCFLYLKKNNLLLSFFTRGLLL